jgi:tetratricopeptide (TPR) repeat protein
MAEEWYARKKWSEADQADFFARLKRSRSSYHKAQYLWVQGRELEKVGLLQEAMALFDKMLAEYPEDFFLALVCQHKASCLAKLGKLDQAVVFYRRALDAQRKEPNHFTQAPNEFGRFVVDHKLKKFYREVLDMLDELKAPGTHFPNEIYEENGIRAIINEELGKHEKAAQFAAVALNAAAQNRSNFRRHPKLGLVKDRESKFYEAIEAIATKHIRSFAN